MTSVRRMAKTLFKTATHTGPWTADEIQNLKRYIGVAQEEIIARILGRSIADVKAQITDLGRIHTDKAWSQSDIADLKRYYGTRTDEDIARIFGRPVASVTNKATELCLAKDKAFVRKLTGTPATRMPRWSKDEIKRLEELYPNHSNLEIATLLERSVKSVVSKAHNLGLRKERGRLAEMGRQNVSLRYGRREDGTKDPNIDTSVGRKDSSSVVTPFRQADEAKAAPEKAQEAGAEKGQAQRCQDEPEQGSTKPEQAETEGESGA